MEHLTEEIFQIAINSMESSFDSHEIIKFIMKNYPREYVLDLCGYSNNDDPILVMHQQIGRKLARQNTIRSNGEVKSENIRGGKTLNEKWTRIDSF
jgi:hypothetical protein